MRTKTKRLKTVCECLRNLKRRKKDADREVKVLNAAITFYEIMKRNIQAE